MYVHIPQTPSPRARELGQKITAVIKLHLDENPGMSSHEIHQAMGVAREHLRSQDRGGGPLPQIMVALVLGVMMMFGLLVFYLKQRSDGEQPQWIMTAVVGTLIVVLLGAVVVTRMRR